MEELTRLAYDAALRALDKQEDVVRELRARTAVVLGAASFAVSVAVAAGLGISPAPAIAAATASLGAALYVLIPQRALVFALDGRAILNAHATLDTPLADIYRGLVYELRRLWQANDRVVARMLVAFRLAVVALAVEILLLLVTVWSTL